jgi:hypothetical protein
MTSMCFSLRVSAFNRQDYQHQDYQHQDYQQASRIFIRLVEQGDSRARYSLRGNLA